MSDLLSVGTEVKHDAFGVGKIADVDEQDPSMPYRVEFEGGDNLWVFKSDVTPTGAVTLTAEQAAEVREALEALGWDREDLGPLAAPEPPKKVIKATITLPDDMEYVLADVENTLAGYGGTIEYED